MSGNTVTLIGNITRTPELRFTPTGRATCTFGLASNRRWQNRQTQEWEEATSFFDVVCWGDLAEHVAESLDRGVRVIAMGRLEQRTWETPEGEKRSKVEVIADEVGPSLRWATTEVKKSARVSGDFSMQASSGYGYAGSGNNRVSVAPASTSPRSGDAGWAEDEEPF